MLPASRGSLSCSRCAGLASSKKAVCARSVKSTLAALPLHPLQCSQQMASNGAVAHLLCRYIVSLGAIATRLTARRSYADRGTGEASQGQCCVCLEALRPPGCGAHAAAPFPTCARHRMHVGCLAQFRVQASGPCELAIALSRLTALRKPTGGVRGIATQGTCFDASSPERWREPSAVSLTRPPARFSSQCRPALGTDSLAAMLRAAVELDPRATVVSFDGRIECLRHHQPRNYTCQATRYRPVAPAFHPRHVCAHLHLLVVGRRGTSARYRAG